MPSRRAIAAGPSFSSICSLRRQLNHSSAPALIDAACLRCSNSLGLAFLSKIGLELGEHPQHVEERLTSSGAGVDRLLGRAERNAPFLRSWTMSWRSFNDRASRSMRVTTRASPGRKKSSSN